jgi:hypothetical protein
MEADGAAQVMENSNVWSNLHQALNRWRLLMPHLKISR